MDLATKRILLAPFVACAVLAGAAQAMAQEWREYAYPDFGFGVQFPGKPTVESGTHMAPGGISVPATVYAFRQPNMILTMTIADLTNTEADGRGVIDRSVRELRSTGEIKVDVTSEINGQYGRQLSISEHEGSRSIFGIFYINHRLYELKGKLLPPNPERRSGDAIRFQQSLRFERAGAGRRN